MSDRQLDWQLLKELECPVCTEYMALPIKMCENGHNICGSCKECQIECPNCRGKFTNVRNITLENFAATAIYPCKNREAGCEETFKIDDINKHLSVCSYQSRQCPIKSILSVDCSWTGTVSDISAHITDVHRRDVVELPEHFNLQLLEFVKGRIYLKPVLFLGKLFFFIGGSKTEYFKFTVVHVGPQEEAEAFKYGIKIGNSAEYVAVTRKCPSHQDVVIEALPRRKCVEINYDTILDFVSESGYLSCEIEIGREKLDGFVLEELQEFLPVVSVASSDID